MKQKLLEWLWCPQCHGTLSLAGSEQLRCEACGGTVPVAGGVPRFVDDRTATAQSFGYMWGLQAEVTEPPTSAVPYHLHLMQHATGAGPLAGVVLDAGCGDGVDLAMLSLSGDCEVVGVELSSGGVATSAARTRGLDHAHLVQADLLDIPIATGTFDAAYSYGVVHHTPDPPRAVREIARTLKRGGQALFYIYEDFSDRPWAWRFALASANGARLVTTRIPPAGLMVVCRVLSPLVYISCTWPARRFRWAARLPYRHGTHPWSMVGDLYDRLSAPIERRYSRKTATALLEQAGLDVLRIEQARGWVLLARKRE